MTRLLVTGADGFVGRHLVRAARAAGSSVIASILPEAVPPAEWQANDAGPAVEVVHADLTVAYDMNRLADQRPDEIVHLAAIASGAAAQRDPAAAMQVNGVGPMWLIDALVTAGCRPRFLMISTGEVYGPGYRGPIAEDAAVNPVSPYAASKWAAEEALEDLGSFSSIPVVIARAFSHTGPGQGTVAVLPALAARLIEAKRSGVHSVRTGNLDVIRDFLDVRDVVQAYLALLKHGVAGECYNVASGVGHRLSDCFAMLAKLVGVDAHPSQDASLLRAADIPVLIGDPAKLQRATGWSPHISFERTLQDLVDAQAH